MTQTIQIGSRIIGPGHPAYIIAEMSANHDHNLNQAVALLHAAKESGADAIKLQTYTADTLTINCKSELFKVGGDSLWQGRYLYDLYQEAFTPWEWHPQLQQAAERLGMAFFSTPFDHSSVDFLESLQVPAYKIASFELVDIPLLQKVASLGKPMIVSTGMATVDEIGEAVETIRQSGNPPVILLKCTSNYPATAETMNLRTLPDLAHRFGTVVGLSDHTMDLAVPVAAVTLGACVIEKHFTLSREAKGPDSAFSLEPEEFAAMVRAVRTTEAALGQPAYGADASDQKSRQFRRSLFVVRDIRAGEAFTHENIRSIRPANGLHTRHYPEVLGKKAACALTAGTPLQREHWI
jgi:pseudaminic acid synthase